MPPHPSQQHHYIPPTARITPASPALPVSTPSSPVATDSRNRTDHRIVSHPASSSAAGPSSSNVSTSSPGPPLPSSRVASRPQYRWSSTEWHNVYPANTRGSSGPASSSGKNADTRRPEDIRCTYSACILCRSMAAGRENRLGTAAIHHQFIHVYRPPAKQ